MKTLKVLAIVLLAMFSYSAVSAQSMHQRRMKHPRMMKHHRRIVRHHKM